jgi:CubicO group peptidase (beta-lactamase class C family)
MLLKPAGLNHTVSLAEDALLFRTAAGHQMGAEGQELVPRWGMDRSTGPMGALCATAEDVIGFGRIHLEDGKGLLSAASVKAMQEPQVPFPGDASGWIGLGWHIHDHGGVRTVGHGGDTPGQHALFELVPEGGFAIAMLTNGPTGRAAYGEVLEHVTTTLGLPSQKPALPTLPDAAPVLDLSKYAGRYERNAVHQIITVDDDKLMLAVEYVDVPYDLTPPPPMALAPITPEQFALLGPDGSVLMTMEFLEFDDDGRPQLSFLGRLASRA